MTKDALPSNQPVTLTNDLTQTSLDQFGDAVTTPMRKLHADEYTVNDLDGVTESATGSGNLNFLMMQAGQTNEEMGDRNPFNIADNGHFHFHDSNGGNAGGGPLPVTQNGFDTAMDRPFDTGGYGGDDGRAGLGQTGNNSNNAGTLSASNFAANTASANPFSDVTNFSAASSSNITNNNPPVPSTNGTNGMNGANGTPGDNGNSGMPGNNGANGTDGMDGTGGPVTTIINNYEDNVTNFYDTTNNTTSNVTNIVNNTTNNSTTIFTNIFDNDGSFGPLGLDLDVTLNDVTNITLDIINGNTITNVIDQTLNTAPILIPVQNIVGDLLSSTSLHVLFNPFQPDVSAGDTDLHIGTSLDVLGVSVPDIQIDVPLDIAEALLGDLDINLDLTNDLLDGVPVIGELLGGGRHGDTDLALDGLGGLLNADALNGAAETLLNPIENIVGDVDIGGSLGLGLLGLDSDQAGTDTDITIPLDIALVDNGVLVDSLAVSLDPLENILGDVDIDLGVAADILGDIAAPLFDSSAGGNGENDLLAQAGDILSGTVEDVLPFGDNDDTDLALGMDIDFLDTGLTDNALDIILNPVEDVVGDIDIGGAIGLDLLGTADSGADSDLSIPFDIGLVDNPVLSDEIGISLDSVESLTGDIDVDLGIGANLLGDVAGPVVDPFEGGSLSGGLLAQSGDDLSGLIGDIALPVTDPLAPVLDDSAGGLLESLSDIINSIDSTLNDTVDSAINLVDSSTPNTGGLDLGALTGDLSGGTLDSGGPAVTTWTETILPTAGDLLGGGLLASDPVSIIPDPVITAPVISLSAVPTVPVSPVISTGGGLLGGHGHHGGLFG